MLHYSRLTKSKKQDILSYITKRQNKQMRYNERRRETQMKKKIIIAGVTAAVLIAGAGIFCVSAGNRENDKKTEITQMTETESETETEPITEVETTTESVTEVQTEAPTEPQTEQVTEPETESVSVDTSYDDTIDTYFYEEDDDTDDTAPADTQPVYEEPEPVYTCLLYTSLSPRDTR